MPQLNPFDQRIVDRITPMIAEHGWACIGVMPTRTQPCVPFLYTIGFRPHRELCVLGLSHEQMWTIIAGVIDLGLDQPCESNEVLVRFPVRLQLASAEVEDYPPNAARLWRRANEMPLEFDLLQIVWPDAHGVFPTDTCYSSGEQPVLPPP